MILSQRPKQLENLCLADFVAWYNCKSEGNDHIKAKPNSSLTDVYLPENNVDDNLDDDLSDLEQTSERDEYEMKGGRRGSRPWRKWLEPRSDFST